MKKFNAEKCLMYLLIGICIYIGFDKVLQTILQYFYGEGKSYATDASKETIRKYTDILTSAISFLIGYFVKSKIDNLNQKQLNDKIQEKDDLNC